MTVHTVGKYSDGGFSLATLTRLLAAGNPFDPVAERAALERQLVERQQSTAAAWAELVALHQQLSTARAILEQQRAAKRHAIQAAKIAAGDRPHQRGCGSGAYGSSSSRQRKGQLPLPLNDPSDWF